MDLSGTESKIWLAIGRGATWTSPAPHDDAVRRLPQNVRAIATDENIDQFTILALLPAQRRHLHPLGSPNGHNGILVARRYGGAWRKHSRELRHEVLLAYRWNGEQLSNALLDVAVERVEPLLRDRVLGMVLKTKPDHPSQGLAMTLVHDEPHDAVERQIAPRRAPNRPLPGPGGEVLRHVAGEERQVVVEQRGGAHEPARGVVPKEPVVAGVPVRVADEGVEHVHGPQHPERFVRDSSGCLQGCGKGGLLGSGPEGDKRRRGIVHERADRGK